MTQQIRLSQYVVTYGPGAILEGPNGPRIIPRPDLGLFLAGQAFSPDDLEVSDQRMSAGLLNDARIFRLPSNAELSQPLNRYIYATRAFPTQSLCLNHGGHGGRFGILYQWPAQQCPVCGNQAQRRREAIRFVVACPQGHLDEVNWTYVVHGGRPAGCRHREWFRWHGGGGALNEVNIECPQCGARERLGRAYGRSWACTGRFPEREGLRDPPARNQQCGAEARIIQRQASNLRLPEIRTLFTIPPRHTQLHVLLQATALYAPLVAEGSPITEARFREIITRLIERNVLSQADGARVLGHPWAEISAAIHDVLTPVQHQYETLLQEELRALLDASINGAPPVHGPAPSSPVVFSVDLQLVRRVPGPRGRTLRITPVPRLRTVTVQTGYRREMPSGPGLQQGGTPVVPVHFTDNANRIWYPGTQFLGEGLFIALDDDESWHFPLAGQATNTWADSDPTSYPPHLFRGATPDELHPVFVWWHTLAHSLLRAVSVDAGYSSTAIRERVFFEWDAVNRRARGGCVLYATQPGSEGTMGGLIALAPRFGTTLERALDSVQVCSNDPLCAEEHYRQGRHSGPACYGCLLVSETSCEHRNLWLDRELLLTNLP